MQIRTRDRIVGGVVLAALAVIFVPMLFDEPTGPSLEIEPMAELAIEPVGDIPSPDVGEVIKRRGELREIVSEDGFLVETATRLGDVTLDTPISETKTWAVQLGSFRNEESANALRERLKEDGQRTWVSRAKIDGNIMTRVAVGPFSELVAANEFRDLAKTRYELDAVVVAFRP